MKVTSCFWIWSSLAEPQTHAKENYKGKLGPHTLGQLPPNPFCDSNLQYFPKSPDKGDSQPMTFPWVWTWPEHLDQTVRFWPSFDLPTWKAQGPLHTAVLLTVTGRSRGLRCLSCRQEAKSTERSRRNELSAYIQTWTGKEDINRAKPSRRTRTDTTTDALVFPPESTKSLVRDPTWMAFHWAHDIDTEWSLTFVHH